MTQPDDSTALLVCPIRGPLTAARLAADAMTPTEEARRIELLEYLISRQYPADKIEVETIVISNLGNSGRNSLRADVTVYDRTIDEIRLLSDDERVEHMLLVAEVKRDSKHKNSAIKYQLEPALRVMPSMNILGIYWDDVNRDLLYKTRQKTNDIEAIVVKTDSLANLPEYGEPYRYVPIVLDRLTHAGNLVATLDSIANVMRSHSVNDEHLRYKETVKLLLARYIDEKLAKSSPDKRLALQVYKTGDPTFLNRVNEIYRRAASRYARAEQLFTPVKESQLEEAALRDCVKVIEGLELSSADTDVMQQVFMSFIPAVFKKSLDQYFTPLTLIDAMVEMSDIGPTDNVADPAMGTADFLTSAMRYRANKGDDDITTRIYGVDKDERAYDLAVVNMILNHDGQSNLLLGDSLEQHDRWAEKMGVALCNPPFGARTLETRNKVLRNFDLGHEWLLNEGTHEWRMSKSTVAQSQQLGILFIERCYKLLEEGGRLAIIVPEGYLCTQSYGYVRQWIMEHFQVLSVVELPRRIFLKSDADLRSNILLLRKDSKVSRSRKYAIHTGLVRQVGYKLARGFTPVYKRNPETGEELRDDKNQLLLATDFDAVRSTFREFMDETQKATIVPDDWKGATNETIWDSNSLDMKPRRLSPAAIANIEGILAAEYVRLGDIATVVDTTVDILAKNGSSNLYRLIEGSDIRAVEGIVTPQAPSRAWQLADRKSKKMFVVQSNDIVVGLVRPERRNIGLVFDKDTNMVAAPDGVAIVRVKPKFASSYPQSWLFSALRTEACRLQFWTESGGTSYGKLTKEQIENVLVPTPTQHVRKEISARVGEWVSASEKALSSWTKIGSPEDRRPIVNSELFGLDAD